MTSRKCTKSTID